MNRTGWLIVLILVIIFWTIPFLIGLIIVECPKFPQSCSGKLTGIPKYIAWLLLALPYIFVGYKVYNAESDDKSDGKKDKYEIQHPKTPVSESTSNEANQDNVEQSTPNNVYQNSAPTPENEVNQAVPSSEQRPNLATGTPGNVWANALSTSQ